MHLYLDNVEVGFTFFWIMPGDIEEHGVCRIWLLSPPHGYKRNRPKTVDTDCIMKMMRAIKNFLYKFTYLI